MFSRIYPEHRNIFYEENFKLFTNMINDLDLLQGLGES